MDPPSDQSTPHGPPTSSAKIAANRRNAQRSTGPQTQEGKSRSSRNAAKHGMYSQFSHAIPRGPFAEDPAEVDRFLREIVADLDPRDSMEEARAWRIAHLQLQEVRVDRWEAAILQAPTAEKTPHILWAHDFEYKLIAQIAGWNEERMKRDAEPDDPENGDVDDDRPWQEMAEWLRDMNRAQLAIRPWNEPPASASSKVWQHAFERLAERLHPHPNDLDMWLRRHNAAMGNREDEAVQQDRLAAARRSLDEMPALLAIRARVTRELGHHLAMYNMMRSRATVPRDSSHFDETNPPDAMEASEGGAISGGGA